MVPSAAAFCNCTVHLRVQDQLTKGMQLPARHFAGTQRSAAAKLLRDVGRPREHAPGGHPWPVRLAIRRRPAAAAAGLQVSLVAAVRRDELCPTLPRLLLLPKSELLGAQALAWAAAAGCTAGILPPHDLP